MSRHFLTWTGRRAFGVAAACIVIAVGGIVLLRAQSYASEGPEATSAAAVPLALAPAAPRPPARPQVAAAATDAPRIEFDHPGLEGSIALTQGAVLAQGRRRIHAEIRAQADETSDAARRPVAMAVVLDVSGSMTGDKIQEARRAVITLVSQMDDDDHVALVVYNDNPEVIQRLARVGDIRGSLISRVARIQAGGGTNIPMGLLNGSQLLTPAPRNLVRRVVLVSDGLDGSGWAPHRVTGRVRSAANAGATFSAFGVGTHYDESFLLRVADAGRGNYQFIARGTELTRYMRRELDQAGSTTVDNVWVQLQLPSGWRVAQAYGAEHRGATGAVRIPFGAMFAGEQRRAVLALDVDAGVAGQTLAIGTNVSYRSAADFERYSFNGGALAVRTVVDQRAVLASQSAAAHADAMEAAIDAQQAAAIEAWRAGNASDAVTQSTGNIRALQALQARSYSASRAARIREFQVDNDNFTQHSAQSERGRAYGLSSNNDRRGRQRGW